MPVSYVNVGKYTLRVRTQTNTSEVYISDYNPKPVPQLEQFAAQKDIAFLVERVIGDSAEFHNERVERIKAMTPETIRLRMQDGIRRKLDEIEKQEKLGP